jgi:hypothetical protein
MKRINRQSRSMTLPASPWRYRVVIEHITRLTYFPSFTDTAVSILRYSCTTASAEGTTRSCVHPHPIIILSHSVPAIPLIHGRPLYGHTVIRSPSHNMACWRHGSELLSMLSPTTAISYLVGTLPYRIFILPITLVSAACTRSLQEWRSSLRHTCADHLLFPRGNQIRRLPFVSLDVAGELNNPYPSICDPCRSCFVPSFSLALSDHRLVVICLI